MTMLATLASTVYIDPSLFSTLLDVIIIIYSVYRLWLVGMQEDGQSSIGLREVVNPSSLVENHLPLWEKKVALFRSYGCCLL